MGCHTWFWIPATITQEEAEKLYVKELEYCSLEWAKMLCVWYLPYTYFMIWWSKLTKSKSYYRYLHKEDIYYPFETKEQIGWYINVNYRSCRMVSKGMCKKAIWRRINGHYRYFDDKGAYECSKKYHDVFRVYGYPDVVLTSYEEVVQYLETCENKTIYDSLERVKEFFIEYPKGLITFG